jgi:hypothetical protein
MGLAVMNELYYHKHYHNFYHRKGGIPGWETTMRTRPLILEALEHIFMKDTIDIKSIRTINELQTFARDDESGKVEKQRGSTDDLLIALGLSLIGIKQALLSSPAIGAMLLPDSGPKVEKPEEKFEDIRYMMKLRKDPYIQEVKLEDGRIMKEDLRWLIE